MPSLPYSACWWCNERFTAGGKYARRVELPEGDVFVHVACEHAARTSRDDVTAACRDHVPTYDEIETAREEDPELEQFEFGG